VASRREFISVAGIGALAIAADARITFAQAQAPVAPAAPVGPAAAVADLILTNGRIHTMDTRNSIVGALAVRNGRFVAVGGQMPSRGAGTRVVDLRGRTVIPGIIDAHNHFVNLGNRPGYHTILENARSIRDIQQTLSDRRRDVPAGEFITAMGGWHTNMFAERRLPTRTELDEAVPDRPVFLLQTFNGPSATNSPGKAFFERDPNPVVVADNGAIAGGMPSTTALYKLRLQQTLETKMRGTVDAWRYSASLGLTAHLDQVGLGSPGPLTPNQSLAAFDPYRMYDAWQELYRQGRAFIRLQTNFSANQNDPQLPMLRERLKNQFPFFGSDLLMTGGIGESAAPGDGAGDVWLAAQRLVAEARWRNENHALSLANLENEVAGYEKVHAQFPISDLRWVIAHVPFATTDLLNRLKAIGAAVQLTGWRYLQGSATNNGSPFRLVLDNGIRAGLHSDSAHISPLNPWLHIYYAVTGVNAAGEPINVEQKISRQEALRLYTRENGWFLRMEQKLGSIEIGKLADVAVLSDDYLAVTDEQIKRIRSVMTIVDGKIVHDAGVLK
jgi:predicted amidohydrolase YtcJ